MFYLIALLFSVAAVAHGETPRSEAIHRFVNRCFPEEIVEMLALNAIEEGSLTADVKELTKRTRSLIQESAPMQKRIEEIYASYTDEQIIRFINFLEDPSFQEMGTASWGPLSKLYEEAAQKALEEIGREKPPVVHSAEVFDLSEENFFEKIAASDRPVVIDVSSEFCQPCHLLKPFFKELAGQYEGEVSFGVLDAASQQRMVKHFKIRGLPTLLVFGAKGELKGEIVGFRSREHLQSELENLLKN